MATSIRATVSGAVLKVTDEVRTSKANNPYTYRHAHIIVDNEVIVDIDFGRDVPLPGKGELVEVSVNITGRVFRDAAQLETRAISCVIVDETDVSSLLDD